MKVLLVYSHPRADSFARAVRSTVEAALGEAGHAVETCDLYAEGFVPALSAAEHRNYEAAEPSDAFARDHIVALQRADALVLVYPTWWYGMPAMLKGWFDRVWIPGVAFRVGEGAIEPLLTNIRRIAVVTTYGSPRWLLWYLGWPDRKLIGRGFRRLCARKARLDWLYLCDMDHAHDTDRAAFLTRIAAHFRGWR